MSHGHVFVSYSHNDLGYVEDLRQHLIRANILTWTDSGINYGSQWHDVIEKQISECSAIIVVMSPSSRLAPWVTREVDLAQELGKPIFPLLLAGRVFFGLRDLHYHDVTDRKMPSVEYTDMLKSHLGGSATDIERQVNQYEVLVERLIGRQKGLYMEKFELTLEVGSHDHLDTVIERRWTSPKSPPLMYRAFCPIVPWGGRAKVTPEELHVTCEVQGRDLEIDLDLIQRPGGSILAFAVFNPGIRKPTEWVIKYRCPGLWNPLRATGEDHLYWSPSSLSHTRNVDETKLNVIYPDGWVGQEVVEYSGQGSCQSVELPSGQTALQWRDQACFSTLYHWTLRGKKK